MNRDILIYSDGSVQGTEVYFGGVKQDDIRSIKFECSVDDIWPKVQVEHIIGRNLSIETTESEKASMIKGIETCLGRSKKRKENNETSTKNIQKTDKEDPNKGTEEQSRLPDDSSK